MYTFDTTTPTVKIRTTLYGEITPERIAVERTIASYRAEQLQPTTFVVRESRMSQKPRVSRDIDDELDMWFETSYQSTGR